MADTLVLSCPIRISQYSAYSHLCDRHHFHTVSLFACVKKIFSNNVRMLGVGTEVNIE